ncbi:MAG: secondary thiamine-phosphate synthase enzyme YjbQ [Eubacteriales bacterium]|jgi:secondary thiamine-phosphate synthase enzyme
MKTFKCYLETDREGMYDITASVRKIVKDSGIADGICVIYCPHTTAGITINENTDPHVCHDILRAMDNAFPDRVDYQHLEGNSFAHIRSTNVGVSQTVIVEGGALMLGTWQALYFCEFDGPRKRKYYVKVMEG